VSFFLTKYKITSDAARVIGCW